MNALGAIALALALGALAAAWSDRRRVRRSVRRLQRSTGAFPSGSGTAALEEAARVLDELRASSIADANELELVRQVLDGLDAAVLVYDRSNRLCLANSKGRSLSAGHHGDALVLAAVRNLVEGFGTGEGPAGRVVELAGPPGRVLELSIRLAGAGDRMVKVTDITERRRLEEIRRDFVANISHELRTPLGAIALLTETLSATDDPELLTRLLHRVHHEALRVNSTIDDLLVLSQIESDDLPEREQVEVRGVVAEAVARVAEAAAARAITIEQVGYATPVDGPVGDAMVSGDRRQLVSAMFNLLDNAVKYSDHGSVVTVRTKAEGDGVVVEVIDRGIGIPTRELDRVFERFYRVDRARSRGTGGTGLGLAIVRHVVHNHGGAVRVESREGVGSTFVLALPRQVVPEGTFAAARR